MNGDTGIVVDVIYATLRVIQIMVEATGLVILLWIYQRLDSILRTARIEASNIDRPPITPPVPKTHKDRT